MALSDLLQGCSNKSDTVMIQQERYKVDNTRLQQCCCIMIVTALLEQPCNKSDNINIQQGCYKLLTACSKLVPNLLTTCNKPCEHNLLAASADSRAVLYIVLQYPWLTAVLYYSVLQYTKVASADSRVVLTVYYSILQYPRLTAVLYYSILHQSRLTAVLYYSILQIASADSRAVPQYTTDSQG